MSTSIKPIKNIFDRVPCIPQGSRSPEEMERHASVMTSTFRMLANDMIEEIFHQCIPPQQNTRSMKDGVFKKMPEALSQTILELEQSTESDSSGNHCE